MNTQYTKGEWKYRNNGEDFTINTSLHGHSIAYVNVELEDIMPVEEAEANARLIASAPEIAKALIWMLQVVEAQGKIDSVTHEGMIEDCKAILDKALTYK